MKKFIIFEYLKEKETPRTDNIITKIFNWINKPYSDYIDRVTEELVVKSNEEQCSALKSAFNKLGIKKYIINDIDDGETIKTILTFGSKQDEIKYINYFGKQVLLNVMERDKL